jgi:pSer/pThr/pTyr-binding forkhead associated (FHA) protein
MYCTHCGHQNPADANYCGNCGRPLSQAEDATTSSLPDLNLGEAQEPVEEPPAAETQAIVSELDPGTALLVSARGPNEGARFLLDRDTVSVGRHPDSDIFLDDITVSRRHAEFRRESQRFWVHDAGSLNGTYVNGKRADSKQLATGDEVQVGKFKLIAYVAEQVGG